MDISSNLLISEPGDQLPSYYQLPRWYQDNEHLEHGYRPSNQSFCYYLKSIFKIHNETLNVWTHLIPAIIFLILLVYSNVKHIVGDNIGDNIALNVYLLSVFLCFLFSSIMHCFHPYTEAVCHKLVKLDYFGISIAILGFYTIFIYYAFYCHERNQIIYYTLCNVLGIITIVTNCFSKFSISNQHRKLRAIVFFSFCASILVPLIHRIIEDYDNEAGFYVEFKYSTVTGILVGLSLFFYITKIPEKYLNRGIFNYIFTSHQIFHVLSFAGLFLFYIGLFDIYRVHKNVDCLIIRKYFI